MSDAREALRALILERFRAAETYMDLPRQAGLLADAILAAGWTPPGERVKPSVEDVARALWELDEQEADATGGALDVPWSALDSLTQGLYRADAEDLLALLPGRTETEVRREAWDEVADYLDRTNAPSLAEAARRDNPYRAGQ